MSNNLTLRYNIIEDGGWVLFWLILACTGNKGQESLLQEDNAIIDFGEQITCLEANHSWSKMQDKAFEGYISILFLTHQEKNANIHREELSLKISMEMVLFI